VVNRAYQEHLYQTLGEKYGAQGAHLDRIVDEANAEMESLQGRIKGKWETSA
jgi:hypothetical protein